MNYHFSLPSPLSPRHYKSTLAATAMLLAMTSLHAQTQEDLLKSNPKDLEVEARYTEVVADNTARFPSKRPPVKERLFRSDAIDKKIEEVKKFLKGNPRLAWMFENCFPNTLETTVHYRQLNGKDDTFVYTGDIPAMWLRDSGGQIYPYIRFAAKDPKLKKVIRGTILCQLRLINIDPYANAFNDGATGAGWQNDATEMKKEVYERKYEIDSLCYPIRLAYAYWLATGDDSIFGDTWNEAIRNILTVFREQQRKTGRGSYHFFRVTDRTYDTVGWGGYGAPVKPIGLIASVFRPSDDATTYPFLVPSNFMAVSSLRKAAEILTKVNKDEAQAKACRELADEVHDALMKYAIYDHPKYGKIYAFEVDGFGNYLLADDANVPGLLGMAYLGDVPADDPVFQNTCRFVWSEDNPWFFKGKAGEGIGGPHQGLGKAWPMSIVMKVYNSTDNQEIAKYMTILMHTDAGTGFMHETFNVDDANDYTRPWFAWCNGLFGELVLKLIDDGKVDLLNSLH